MKYVSKLEWHLLSFSCCPSDVQGRNWGISSNFGSAEDLRRSKCWIKISKPKYLKPDWFYILEYMPILLPDSNVNKCASLAQNFCNYYMYLSKLFLGQWGKASKTSSDSRQVESLHQHSTKQTTISVILWQKLRWKTEKDWSHSFTTHCTVWQMPNTFHMAYFHCLLAFFKCLCAWWSLAPSVVWLDF